jgi:hypothetical protein
MAQHVTQALRGEIKMFGHVLSLSRPVTQTNHPPRTPFNRERNAPTRNATWLHHPKHKVTNGDVILRPVHIAGPGTLAPRIVEIEGLRVGRGRVA